MEKRLEKDLYSEVSLAAAQAIMETLRKEGYEDLPRKFQDLKGSTLVLTYQVPDPVVFKVRPQVGDTICFEQHELRVGDRVEHPILLDRDGNHQGTVVVKEVRPRSFTYDKRGLGDCWGCDNKTWIFRGVAKTHPALGESIDFCRHELKPGDYISSINKDALPGPYLVLDGKDHHWNIKHSVSGARTSAFADNFWKRVEPPKPPVVYPKVGQKVRWANERGDSCTGRVYEIKDHQFWFIVDEFTGYGGPKGCQSYITKLHIENGSCKVIAD